MTEHSMAIEEHHRKLERLYLSAPTNAYYKPAISIGAGIAEIQIEVRSDFFHAAAAVHGSVYFKLLDDAGLLGIESPASPDELTPVEQEALSPDVPLEEALGSILWPEGVAGCALVMERLVVKGSDETLAADEDPTASGRETEEIRMVAGVLRDGSRHCAMRMRSHDSETEVLNGPDLIPALTSALALTLDLEEEPPGKGS